METYSEYAHLNRIVIKWFQNCSSGYMSTSDTERSERPNDAYTTEMINLSHDVKITDRKFKVSEIVSVMDISGRIVYNILHRNLNIKRDINIITRQKIHKKLTRKHCYTFCIRNAECINLST